MWLHVFIVTLVTVVVYQWNKNRTKKDLKGQLVLITGGALGLGKQLTLDFLSKGAKVIVWDINPENLDKLRTDVPATYMNALSTFKCDVTNREAVYDLAKKVQKEIGKVDILVNNAGVVGAKPLLELHDKQIELTMNVNTLAHFWTVRAFLPAMLKTNKGHIVNVASVMGMTGMVGNMTDYSASKFGSFGFTEALRFELKTKHKASGVHTTLVCPYHISTTMFTGLSLKGWVNSLVPTLTVEYVSASVVSAVEKEIEWIVLPAIFHVLPVVRAILPLSLCDWVAATVGTSTAMDSFAGKRHFNFDNDKKDE